MRKRFTKIICAAAAVISAFGLVFASACGNLKWKPVSEKDTTAETVISNGGFLVQTGDYVYFINGMENYNADNTFGEVLKGSVQRIKKSDLEGGNYSYTETIVPSIAYAGQYNAGIYIFGDYIYYTTPSTQKDGSGNVLNSTLDFRRTTLDGAETDRTHLWQCTDNSVDYRYAEVDGNVYILYALSENLYGTSTTNIHSVNVSTGTDTLLAYNVESYVFDTENPANPVAYYTMKVPYFVGGSSTYSYNQVYRVRADVAQSPREYDFSEVEDYDAEKDPVYVNYGDYVFDGIGTTQSQTEGRVTQFNFAHWHTDKTYSIANSEYTYTLDSYKDGELLYTRKESVGSSVGARYKLSDEAVDSDANGSVDGSWDAIESNSQAEKFLILSDSNSYEFFTLGGKTYAINTGSSGITKGELVNGVVEDVYTISEDASAEALFIRSETTDIGENVYLYYSMSGGNGHTFYRIAIDGEEADYKDLSTETEWNNTWTYRGVRILDLDACADWYEPEFVGNTLVFASETYGMSSYNYIMACDLGKDGKMLTNKQIHDLNEKFEEVTEKIEDYDDETNADGSMAYENLSNALKYYYYTLDEDYLDELIKAYVDIEGRDEEYFYSVRSAEIYHEFARVQGDWAEYLQDAKVRNGGTVYANNRDYYYGLLGKMTESDKDGLTDYYKSQFMQSYPVDDSTWWDNLSAGAKAGIIIGICAGGLVVLGGIAVAVIFAVKHYKKKKQGGVNDSKMKVDITDDKNVNVYDDQQ